MKRVFLIMIALFSASVVSFGQNTATFNASGKVITALVVTKGLDMDFGTFYTGSGGGTLKIDVTSTTPDRKTTIDVKTVNSSTFSAATFSLAGENGYQYTVSVSP